MPKTIYKGIVDAEHNKIAILINNTIFVYEKYNNYTGAYVVLIIFLCFCIGAFVTFCYQNCKHRFSKPNWSSNN